LSGLVASLSGQRFWVRNTFEHRARIELNITLPHFLTAREWCLSAEGGPSFILGPNERRAVMLRLRAGTEVEARGGGWSRGT